MKKKNVGGRPSIKTWNAILNYAIMGDDGEFGKWKQLKDSKNNPIFENSDLAIETLEDLQIDMQVKYIIFIQLNDAESVMTPAEQTRIKYAHSDVEEDEEETIEEKPADEAKEESESLIKDTPNEVVDENLKNIIKEDKQEEAESSNEIPEIGDDD